MAAQKKHITIVGSGLIGRSWAMLFASGGYKVFLHDVVQKQVDSALKDISENITKFAQEGTLRGSLSPEQQIKLVEGSSDLEASVKGAMHIQECVPDNLELKQKVFCELDSMVDVSTVLASSTSSIPISRISVNLCHKAQCIVAHPVNPPYLMPLVEVVPSTWTAPEVVTSTKELMINIGQAPVIVNKEIPSFIQPRIQYSMIMECIRLVQDDVLSVEDVDKVMTYGLGPRYAFMGPFETAHLNAEGFQDYCNRYGGAIFNVTSDSGAPVPMRADSEIMTDINNQLENLIPLDQSQERRKWRDEGIARLSQIRQNIRDGDSDVTKPLT